MSVSLHIYIVSSISAHRIDGFMIPIYVAMTENEYSCGDDCLRAREIGETIHNIHMPAINYLYSGCIYKCIYK